MKTYRSVTFVIIALLIFGLAACTRSLPGAKPSAEAEATSQTLPLDSTDVMDTLYTFSTQTAMAGMQGQPTVPVPLTGQETAAAQSTADAAAQMPPSETPQPTSPPVVAPTATPGIPASYTIQKGEFPFCIARRFNVNPSEMLQISGLAGSQNYPQGTVLKIPQTGAGFPGNRTLRSHPTTYTVQSDDTIYSIACLFGDVDPESIAFVNNLTKPFKLTVGQTISIP